MPQISIIVPVYNAEKFIHRCVDSILSQTFSDFELILVDDGSPDGSGAICDVYAEKDSRVRVIHKQNGGPSSARNVGMHAATGNFLMFCDSDDYVSPDWCKRLHDCACIDPNAFVVSNLWKVINDIQTPYQPVSEENEVTDYFSLYKKGITAYTVNKIYNHALISRNNLLFDESRSLGEDTVFNAQYCALCHTCIYIPQPLYYYIKRCDSISTRYDPYMFERNIPFFWLRVPLISDQSLGDFCDIWLYHFINLFNNVFDKRNTMTFVQKIKYNQKMLSAKEVQFCIAHAAGKTENPRILRILKRKNYYLFWLVTRISHMKNKVKGWIRPGYGKCNCSGL